MDNTTKMYTKMYGYMIWRGVATIIIGALFLIGSLIYVGFYANGYSVAQQIIVVLIALIAAATIISLLWMVWMKTGMKEFKAKMWQK